MFAVDLAHRSRPGITVSRRGKTSRRGQRWASLAPHWAPRVRRAHGLEWPVRADAGGMSTIHFNQTTRSRPKQFIGLDDFVPPALTVIARQGRTQGTLDQGLPRATQHPHGANPAPANGTLPASF